MIFSGLKYCTVNPPQISKLLLRGETLGQILSIGKPKVPNRQTAKVHRLLWVSPLVSRPYNIENAFSPNVDDTHSSNNFEAKEKCIGQVVKIYIRLENL